MITIATFNIRYPNPDDGINFFPHRLPHIVRKLQEAKPDLIGFQELMQEPFEKLAANLPEYEFVGKGRGPHFEDESNRIGFRKELFTCKESGQFWLSPTPDIPGSRYEQQSICPRICTWAKLSCKSTGKEMLMVNTHLDHEQEYAREEGLKQIFRFVAEKSANLPVFITGDFNLTPEEKPYAQIAANGFYDLTAGMSATYHGYDKDEPVKIDYILTNHPVCCTRERWHQIIDGVYLSDHDPILIHWEN